MRERTTWNRDLITAAKTVTADPYAMNQDHLQQQPKADKYLTGDPSTFAEDITEPNTWDREYAGGTTDRNEIGMPAFRDETFNHGERSASSMDEATLVKKANLCTTVARMILKGRKFATEKAADEAVESQAVSLMYMPNTDLINMASRLAAEEQFPGGQFPQEQQAAQDQAQQAAMQQQSAYQQATQQCMQALQKGDQQGAQAAMQEMVQQAAKMHQARRAAEEGQQQGQQQGAQQQQATQEGEQQGQPAQQQQQQATMDTQALETMLAQATQQAVQAADYDAKKGPAINPPGYGPANGPQAGGAKKEAQDQGQQQGQPAQQQQQAQQVQQQGQPQQQGQQAQQQIQQQGQPAQQQAVQQQQADDQLLDDMLNGPQAGEQGMSEVDIEMEPSAMDVGDIVLSATEDEVLKTLFANEETQDAEQAQQGQQKQGGMSRTASSNPSTRTLGTRPTGGVSKIGGAPAGRSGSDVDSLTTLWPSAPDVREAFNIR